MPGPFIFIATNRLREGRFHAEQQRVPTLAGFIEANEPRLIAFNEYVNEERSEVTVVQVHPDAASFEFHLGVVGDRAREAYARTLEATTSIEVFGTPTETILRTLGQQAGSGVRLKIYPHHLGGFTRTPRHRCPPAGPADPASNLLRLTCNNNLLPRSVRCMDRGRLSRIRGALTPREWAHATGMAAVVIGLHVVGWVTLLAIVVPGHYSIGTQAFGAGIGITAYTLGARHAFDADHISAIDNTTRKLMADGKRPLSVGFFFSLGHSTVVFVLALLLSLGMRAIIGPVRNDSSALHHVTNLVGTGVSGTFLYLIAAINLVILAGILKVFRELRQGRFDEQALEARLNERGFVNRLFGNLMRSIRRPGQMYGVGLLFGLGFDTATEVALLVLAGTGAASGLPWYAILCLPVLFAAGMSLLDTIDGSFMNFAYGWAFSNPVRKVYYNITITGLSVVVALLIGTVELAGLVGQQLSLGGPFWTWVEGLNINTLGFFIVGLFVATWALAMFAWRAFRIEQRFASRAPRRPRELPEAAD